MFCILFYLVFFASKLEVPIFYHLSFDFVSFISLQIPSKTSSFQPFYLHFILSCFVHIFNAISFFVCYLCSTPSIFLSKHFKYLAYSIGIFCNMYTNLSFFHLVLLLFFFVFVILCFSFYMLVLFFRFSIRSILLLAVETCAHWVIYTQLSGTRVAINIFLIAWTLISKSIDVAFAEAVAAVAVATVAAVVVVVVVAGPIATAVTIAVDVGFIVPVAVVLQLLLLFVKYEPSIKSWDGTFVVTDFSSKFFGRFSWPEYLMSYW